MVNLRNPIYQLILVMGLFISFKASAQQYSYGTYSLFPQGASRAMGMGGAYTAISDDASGIVFNPAGLSMSKWRYDLGGTVNNVSNKEAVIFGNGIATNLSYNFLFGAIGVRLGTWVIAVGVSSPYYLDYDVSPQRAKMIIASGDVLIAKKLSDKWGIGVSGHAEQLTQSYKDAINSEVSTTANVQYPRIGLIYRDSRVRAGVSYVAAHGFDVDESLNSSLTGVTWFRDSVVPAKLSFGISYELSGGKRLVIDVDKIEAVKNAIVVGTGTDGSNPITSIAEVQSTVVHGGLEWTVSQSSGSDVIFRVGGYNEPARTLNASSRSHLTLGLDVRFGPVVLSVAFDQARDFTNTAQGFTLKVGAI